MLLSALNQNLVQFTLRPGVQVTVYAAHHSAGKQPQIPLSTFECGQPCASLLVHYSEGGNQLTN